MGSNEHLLSVDDCMGGGEALVYRGNYDSGSWTLKIDHKQVKVLFWLKNTDILPNNFQPIFW